MGMVIHKSIGTVLFDILNHVFLAFLSLLCILPLVHVLAVSFSDSAASAANLVKLWPVGFHVEAYKKIFRTGEFLDAFTISVLRVIAGTVIKMFLVVITAYPLAREPEELRGRDVFMWVIFFTTLFGGGLIPTYFLIRDLGLIDNYLVLVINSGIVNVFNIIVLMNFFRRLPKSLYEAAMIDGADHWKILFSIFIPLSAASIATLTLFNMVGTWNDWFTGMIYLNDRSKYPLQTYLRQMIVGVDWENLSVEDLEAMSKISDRTNKAAQIFVATFPILCVYPFLQKHFVKGLVVGSVKE